VAANGVCSFGKEKRSACWLRGYGKGKPSGELQNGTNTLAFLLKFNNFLFPSIFFRFDTMVFNSVGKVE
jgi:hypothetical protein